VLVVREVETPLAADICWRSGSTVSWTASTEQLLAHSRGTWGSDVTVVRGRSALDASLSISAIEDTWDSCEGGSEEREGDEDSLDGNHFDRWKRKMFGKARRLSEC